MNIENIADCNESICESSTPAERAIHLGNRIVGFIERHPAVPVIVFSIGVFGSMGRTAIKSGWTPEQIIGLGKAFPVQATIPALSL